MNPAAQCLPGLEWVPSIPTDIPNIPGLRYVPEFLTVHEHDALLRAVDGSPWDSRMSRRVQPYGAAYRGIPETDVPPMPAWGWDLAEKLQLDGLTHRLCDQLLVNEYLPGQGIAAHVDYSPYDRTIVSVSLGSPCVMDLDRPDGSGKTAIMLEPRSALILSDEARYGWRHGIAKRKSDVYHGVRFERGRRVSLTLRSIVQR